MNIYGIALIQNGVKFDFPFEESLRSMAPIVKKSVVNCGIGNDGTYERLLTIPGVEVLQREWDLSRKDRGHIFSDETNACLAHLRAECDPVADRDAWVLYLQSDEVIHEGELEMIRRDIAQAEAMGHDVVRFRYIHFWQEHNKIAINKKWYPQEIRAVKLFSPVLSYGDAQTFCHFQSIYESDAHIYHYGHVREKSAYKEKVDTMIGYYTDEKNYKRYARKWKGRDRHTETLDYYGPHPQVIHARIERLGGIITLPDANTVYVVAPSRSLFSERFLRSIRAEHVQFVKSVREVPADQRRRMVIYRPNWWQTLLGNNHTRHVPTQMRSKLARPWSHDFILMLKLSAIHVSVA